MKRVKNLAIYMAVCSLAFFQSCKKDENKNPLNKTFYGLSQTLGNGKIRSFVLLDETGKPKIIGMRFTEGALSGLPSDSTIEHDTEVPLPGEAASTGFDHLEVDWNPVGHEPKAIYGLPHFDFHFYRITKEEQSNIVGGTDTIAVPLEFIPKDYVSGVVSVPDMGVHWFDVKAPEFNGQKFTDTYIYGFYHGKLCFVEPMATQSFISGKPDFKIQIKQPQAFQKTGYYPAVQHLYFDSSSMEYVMALEGLTLNTGSEKN